MPDLARHTRGVLPAVSIGAAASPGAALAPLREVGAIGQRTTQEGLALQEKAELAMTNSQLNEYKVGIIGLQNDLADRMRDNKNDPTKYAAFFEDFERDAEGLSGLLNTSMAKDKGAEWWAIQHETTRAKMEMETDLVSVANGVATYNATRVHTVGALDAQWAIENADDAVALGIDSKLVAVNLEEDLRKIADGIKVLQKKADTEAEKQQINAVLAEARTVYDQARKLGKTSEQALKKARAVIRNSKLIPESRKQELQSDLVAEANYDKAAENEQLEATRESDRDTLGKEIEAGTATYGKINATSLDEKEQESYRIKMHAEAKRRAEGVEIEVDQDVKGRLTEMAWDIADGTADIKDFRKKVETAFKAEPPLIDAATRNSLLTLGEGKYAPYFANAMKKREAHAKGQLVDLPSEQSYLEALRLRLTQSERDRLTSTRKLQLDNWDRYKRALEEWFERPENKDPSAGKIYTDSMEILTNYRIPTDRLRTRAEAEKRDKTLKRTTRPGFLGRKETEFPKGFRPLDKSDISPLLLKQYRAAIKNFSPATLSRLKAIWEENVKNDEDAKKFLEEFENIVK